MHPERLPPKSDPESHQSERLATSLAIMLTLVFGGGFLVFLVVITFNVFLGVAAVALGVAAFVGVHYLIWGRSKTTDRE